MRGQFALMVGRARQLILGAPKCPTVGAFYWPGRLTANDRTTVQWSRSTTGIADTFWEMHLVHA